MTAVNSAINRRRRIIIDGTLEHPAVVVPCSPEKPTKVRLEDPQDSKVEDSVEALIDASSGADDIAPLKGLDDLPEDHTNAAIMTEASKLQKTSEQAAVEESTEHAKAHGIRSVSDSSSTKKRRWGMWGGSKQNKAMEQVTEATNADRNSPQSARITRLRGGNAREPRLGEQL